LSIDSKKLLKKDLTDKERIVSTSTHIKEVLTWEIGRLKKDIQIY
jgi:hypothetical protein